MHSIIIIIIIIAHQHKAAGVKLLLLFYLFIFLPSVSIPEGGLKIDDNKLKGYDAQSVQSLLLLL